MTKKLLLGSDYDGTFRRYGEFPEKEDVDAVQEFRRRGNIFGVVTGRTPAELAWILDKFSDVCDFLLCSTGGVCLFPGKDIVFSNEMGPEDLPELYRICREVGAVHCHSDAMSLTADFATAEDIHRAYPGEDTDDQFFIIGYIDGVSSHVCVTPEGMKGIATLTQFTSYFPGSEECVEAIKRIDARFGDKYKCHYLGNGFDMTIAASSKPDGIARVAAHVGIEKDCIYTAGDGWNDVEMLKAYNGIAMSGTGRGIMDSAKWVYDSVGEAVYDLFDLPRE